MGKAKKNSSSFCILTATIHYYLIELLIINILVQLSGRLAAVLAVEWPPSSELFHICSAPNARVWHVSATCVLLLSHTVAPPARRELDGSFWDVWPPFVLIVVLNTEVVPAEGFFSDQSMVVAIFSGQVRTW